MFEITVALLIISTSSFQGVSTDSTTGALETFFTESNNKSSNCKFTIIEKSIVPDDFKQIQEIVKKWSEDKKGIKLILTSGGTGFSDLDITPEVSL